MHYFTQLTERHQCGTIKTRKYFQKSNAGHAYRFIKNQ